MHGWQLWQLFRGGVKTEKKCARTGSKFLFWTCITHYKHNAPASHRNLKGATTGLE